MFHFQTGTYTHTLNIKVETHLVSPSYGPVLTSFFVLARLSSLSGRGYYHLFYRALPSGGGFFFGGLLKKEKGLFWSRRRRRRLQRLMSGRPCFGKAPSYDDDAERPAEGVVSNAEKGGRGVWRVLRLTRKVPPPNLLSPEELLYYAPLLKVPF